MEDQVMQLMVVKIKNYNLLIIIKIIILIFLLESLYLNYNLFIEIIFKGI